MQQGGLLQQLGAEQGACMAREKVALPSAVLPCAHALCCGLWCEPLVMAWAITGAQTRKPVHLCKS